MSKTKTIRKPVVSRVTDKSLIGLTTIACYSNYYGKRLRKRVMMSHDILYLQCETLEDDGTWKKRPGALINDTETILLLMMKEIQKLKGGSK